MFGSRSSPLSRMAIVWALEMCGSGAFAQTTSYPAFEVASIKPAAADSRFSLRPGPGGGITITNVSLKEMIVIAYRVEPFQISGGPPWLESLRFDVIAKPETRPPQDEIPLMLQSLLAQRFQLRIHRDTRDLPIYAIVLAKKDGHLGPGLVESPKGSCTEPDPSSPPPPLKRGVPPVRYCGSLSATAKKVTGVSVQVSLLAPLFSRLVGRKVVDKTGLTGSFDVTAEWTLDEIQSKPFNPNGRGSQSADASGPQTADTSGPSMFAALQEQLGLKLESQKGPVDILIIDQAEKPSDN